MFVSRSLSQQLTEWKDSPIRKPLLLRGARQVGKSSLVEAFGKKYFENVVSINFELSPEFKQCFQTLKPDEICAAIQVLSREKIESGKTLLFLDEIQDCPQAIQSLRYFKEKMSELHVIGAGSLLELVLKEADFRLPVGRIGSLYLYPLSFKECIGTLNPAALDYIINATLDKPVPVAIHEYLLQQVRDYFFVGGMPESFASYYSLHDMRIVQTIQTSILETYRNDFGHYDSVSNPKHMKLCFDQIPKMIGQQIKYNKIDPDLRSRELKEAIAVLEDANIFQRVCASSASGLPLDATINEKKFKINFVDVGLVKRTQQLDASLLLEKDFLLLDRGGLAEQFVGQELLVYGESFEKTKLYFWARDQAGRAEVDYLLNVGTNIYPIEVKAGQIGKLRSLQQYLLTHTAQLGIRISAQPLSLRDNILSVPFYMVSELRRLLSTFL